MGDDTLARMFWARADRSSAKPAQQFKQGGAWKTLTWHEVGTAVREVALGLLALGWMWRKGAESAVPLVLVATIFLFVAGGLADVTTLGHSQVPSTWSPAFARLLVTLTLGLGAGLAVASAFRLRAPPTTTRKDAAARSAAARVTS